jgi:uncharacterized protein YaiL (DUF2058 family)
MAVITQRILINPLNQIKMASKQTTNKFGKKEMTIEIDRLIEMLEICVKEGDTHFNLTTGDSGNFTISTTKGEVSQLHSVLITNESQM